MPANSWSYEYQFSKFAELVNERSGGRLVIEVFPPGTIVDAYEQLVQSKGKEIIYKSHPTLITSGVWFPGC